MIEFIKSGNILDSDTEALVNTVNTVGVMGKGIALQFKKAYPENFKKYEKAAKEKKLHPGKIFVTNTDNLNNPKFIVNFPTKEHWRYPSKLIWIKEGLKDLRDFIIKEKILSISIPPLGCGNGKLDWNDVKPLVIEALSDIPELHAIIYEPSDFVYSSPKQYIKTKKPKLTSVRAMVLAIFNQYTILGYQLTLIEAQKLVYFLQRFGENLKLDFVKGKYGPYNDKLVHVLYDMEGFYLKGMKEKTAQPLDVIQINSGEIESINNFIEENCTLEQKSRLADVYALIEGFESPLGMELLATVDYVIHKELNNNFNTQKLASAIYNWSERKRNLMKPEFITAARERLLSASDKLYNKI